MHANRSILHIGSAHHGCGKAPNCITPQAYTLQFRVSQFVNVSRPMVPESCIAHGRPECREHPYWCPLSSLADTDQSLAPPQLYGTAPCSLAKQCNLTQFQFFRGLSVASARCLAGKRVVLMGDSVMGELMQEWMLEFASGYETFVRSYLDLEYKFEKAPGTRVAEGPLEAVFWPNQRNMTFRDARLNLTVEFLYSGHQDLRRNYGGLKTLLASPFEGELRRTGIHPYTPAALSPDIVITQTSYHDLLSTSCSPARCQCAHTPWQPTYRAYVQDCRAAAWLLAGLQRRGTQVVLLSMHPRGDEPHWARLDHLRATQDHAMLTALEASGFLELGGRYVDTWPLYAAYYDLARHKRADYGGGEPTHSSPLTMRSSAIESDLTSMRLQFALNAACGTAAPLCGVGSSFVPQAEFVLRLQPQCACHREGTRSMDAVLASDHVFCNASTGDPPAKGHATSPDLVKSHCTRAAHDAGAC